MKRLVTKKRALLLLGSTCTMVIAGVAYAYFSSTGSGTATATVGSSAALTIKGTVGSNLYPGGSATVSFTVDNPGSGSQRVGTISLSSISVDAGHSTCSKSITGGNPDFSMPAVTVNKVFAPGNGQAVTPTGTLTMNDTGVSQDACQGATLTLNLTSN